MEQQYDDSLEDEEEPARQDSPHDTSTACEAQVDHQLSKISSTKEDFWNVLASEQEQINTEYEKAVQDLLSLEEPLQTVQSVVTRMHDQTQRYRTGLKRKDAEIKEKEEKIERLIATVNKYKNSITIDEKNALDQTLLNLQKQVDMSHLREQDLQETVDYLRKQVKHLEQFVEQKEVEAAELDADNPRVASASKLNLSNLLDACLLEQNGNVLKLSCLELMGRTREGMQKEKERMKKIMSQTEAMVSTANAEREEYARLYDTSKSVIDDLKKQFSDKIKQAEQLTQQATSSEQTIADLKKSYNELVNEYESIYDMYLDCFKQLNIHRDTNHELAAGIEELFKENEDYEESEKLLKRKVNILKVRISANERRYAELSADYEAQCGELDRLTKEVQNVKEIKINAAEEGSKSQIVADAASKSMAKLQTLPGVREPKPFLDVELKSLEKSLKEKDKKIAELTAFIEHTQTEKKLLTENVAKIMNVNSDLQAQTKQQATSLVEMDRVLSEARQQLRDSRNEADHLKREKRRMVTDKSNCQSKVNDLMELVHQYEEQMNQARKEVVEKSRQLRKERNILNAVKAERNNQLAKWQEAKSMLQEQKRITNVEATLIQQLKEEVFARDKKLTKDQLALKKLGAKHNSTILHESKLEKKVEELKTEASKFDALKKDFENAKKEDEKEKQAIMKRQAKFQKEMGVINTLLDRRMVELGLSYEKMDLLRKILGQTESQYKERTEDVRLLKLEVKKLRYKNQILQSTFKNMADLQHEIHHLNRDLATERQKCHALQEELETPINFHRWRVLERVAVNARSKAKRPIYTASNSRGTDPEKRDLIDKVQILQKKLLKEKENIALGRERFKDLEEVYTQLKKKLINLPYSDVVEELNHTKRALKDKTDENRDLAVTLASREGEVLDFKYKIDKLQKQYDELRKTLFDEKRSRDRAKMKLFEERQTKKEKTSEENILPVLGGGFRKVTVA